MPNPPALLQHPAKRRALSLLILLAFLSGASALTYEVVWQQMLRPVFGITTHATTVVLASFLGGMAVGGVLLGRLADRQDRPVRLFAWIELGIAGAADAFPLLVPLALRLYAAAPSALHESRPLSIALRLVLCLPLLLLPALLMGGTLPVLGRLAARRPEASGRWLGLVYGFNTAGAVAGCVLAGFVLLPAIGARWSVRLAAGLNLFVGLAALALSTRLDRDLTAPAAAAPRGERLEAPRWLLPAAALVTGACALAYEVLWTRILAGFLQADAYAFPTMLATFLAGAALGSLLLARWLDRASATTAPLGALQAGIGLVALGGAYQVTRLRELQPWLGERLPAGWPGVHGMGFAASAFLMLAPCLLMGASFPLLCRLHARSPAALGRGVGACYAANLTGCVAGAALAGFLLIPLAGVTRSIVIVSAASGLLGAVLLAAAGSGRARFAQLAALLVAYAAAATWLVPWGTPLPLFSLDLRDVRNDPRLLYHDEGVAGTVTVMRSRPHYYESRRFTFIEVDGVEVAGDSPMLRVTQKVQGHVPPLLFAAQHGRPPARAFVLGLGSGEASSCSVQHVTQRLDCIELCDGEIGASVHFHPINRRVLEHPRLRLVINDARNHLLTTRERYDVIMSDSTHPAVAGETYTLEYYRLCRSRLTEQGIFSTWVPLYDLSAADLRCLLATMLEAFGRVSIWYPPHYSGKHAVFLAGRRPLDLDAGALAGALARPVVRDSLASIDVRDPAGLLALFVADERTIGPAVRGAPLNTDDDQRLALGIPRNARRGEETVPENLRLLTDLACSAVPLVRRPSPALTSALRLREQARDLLLRGVAASYDNRRREALDAFARALDLLPGDPTIRYLIDKTRFGEAYAAGVDAAQRRDYSRALAHFAGALQVRPGNVHVLNFSGACYYNLGRLDEAIGQFRQALDRLPDFAWSRYNLALALERAGRRAQARRQLERILAGHPRMEQARALLQRLR